MVKASANSIGPRFDPQSRNSSCAASLLDVDRVRGLIGGALYLVSMLRQVKDPIHGLNV